MRRLKKILGETPTYWIAIVFLLLLATMSLIAPLIPIDPNAIDVTRMNQPPSAAHWFGTDELGRDYFIRVVYGGRISLTVGLLAMLTATLIGTVVGLVSGFFGGFVDNLFMRLVDVLSSIPWLVLVIVLSTLLRPGMTTIIIVIGGFSWMEISRLIRAEAMATKHRDYVDYATFLGVKKAAIIWRHLMPAVLPTLIVAASNSISGAIMTESALSFLGMGIQPPTASWGSLLQNGQSALQRAPHMALLPGLFIALTVYSFNKIGELFQDFMERKI